MKKVLSFVVTAGLLTSSASSVLAQRTRTGSTAAAKTELLARGQKIRMRGATATVSNIAAYTDGVGGVYVKWNADVERGNAGFLVHRTSPDGTTSTGRLVPGAAMTSTEAEVAGRSYSYFDVDGRVGDTYAVESLGMDGRRSKSDPISVRAVRDVSVVAGRSSADLAAAATAVAVPDKNEADVPSELITEQRQNAIAPDPDRQQWVAAQPGVKIGVKQDGFYRVTRTELQNAGFDVNAPSAQWQLYMNGVEQAIVVAPDDSYIDFYGRAIDTTESGTNVYFLVVGTEPGKRVKTLIQRPFGSFARSVSYNQTFVRKDRAAYLSSGLLNGDAENFFGDVPIIGSASGPGNPLNTTITLTGIDFTAPTATIRVKYQGINSVAHSISTKINGNTLPTVSTVGTLSFGGTFTVPTSWLVEGTNAISIQALSGSSDVSLIDTISVGFARKFQAQSNRLSFYTTNYRPTRLTNLGSSAVSIFDLTLPDTPTLLGGITVTSNGDGTFNASIPANRGRIVYAATDAGMLQASSIVRNFPSTLATTAHNAELIVITQRAWMTEANDWADYRRSQGATAEVVDIQDIFDEFGYGVQSTTAIMAFLQNAKANWQTPPGYVLILGDATSDPRDYLNDPFKNYILTKFVDTAYEETGSDEAMCDFDNDGVAELAVGRIPARSGAVVTAMLNKTKSFEANLATAPARGALFASDLPVGYDFEALSARLATKVSSNVQITALNRGATDSRTTLLARLNSGPYFVNYSGHGSSGIWQGNWLTSSDPATMSNNPNYTMYFMLTCLNGYFLIPNFDSLGEKLLLSNGGGVAVWASTGKTTPDVQEVMADRFYTQMTAGNIKRVGDLINDSKRSLVGGLDVRLSWALLGDPMLKVRP